MRMRLQRLCLCVCVCVCVCIVYLQGSRDVCARPLCMNLFSCSNFSTLFCALCSLVGVCTAGEPVMVILEYCEHGSLKSFLEASENLTELTRLSFAGDCAAGLAYLAGRGFIHRDIASRNVLLSSEKKCKISDVRCALLIRCCCCCCCCFLFLDQYCCDFLACSSNFHC